MRRSTLWLAVAMGAVTTAPAFGGAFVLPLNFAPSRDIATIQAGQADNYFTSGGPIRAPGDYIAIDPKGAVTKLGAGTAFRELTVIEAPITSEGTWRISTGDRVARTTKWARIDGAWKMIRQPQPAGRGGEGRGPGGPAGAGGAPGGPPGGPGGGPNQIDEADVPATAERAESVQMLKAETYVSKGAPNKAALAPSGKGLELVPVTHPDEVYAGDAFKFSFVKDGQPLAGLAYTVVKGGDQYADNQTHLGGKTDAKGAGAVTLKDPGVYVLEASWPGAGGPPQPGVAPNPVSIAYTLTFEVTR